MGVLGTAVVQATDLQAIITNITDTATAVMPVALSAFGVLLGIKLVPKLFKRISGAK